MATKRTLYLPVKGGEEVVIDLGGYGLTVELDPKRRWYDVEYVKIDHDGAQVVTKRIEADMVVQNGGRQTVRGAKRVRIWRHGPQRPR